MWREGEGKRATAEITVTGRFAPDILQANPAADAGHGKAAAGAGTGGQSDLQEFGTIEARSSGGTAPAAIKPARAGALEQHPPLESARAHNGKALEDLFPRAAEIGRHQGHL